MVGDDLPGDELFDGQDFTGGSGGGFVDGAQSSGTDLCGFVQERVPGEMAFMGGEKDDFAHGGVAGAEAGRGGRGGATAAGRGVEECDEDDGEEDEEGGGDGDDGGDAEEMAAAVGGRVVAGFRRAVGVGVEDEWFGYVKDAGFVDERGADAEIVVYGGWI